VIEVRRAVIPALETSSRSFETGGSHLPRWVVPSKFGQTSTASVSNLFDTPFTEESLRVRAERSKITLDMPNKGRHLKINLPDQRSCMDDGTDIF
jgi:hypothetical protein